MPVIIDGSQGITFPDTSRQYNGYFGFKNRIINGDMRIDQRNAGASVTPTSGTYTVDRWRFDVSQASKLTAQQNAGSVTPPVGFINYQGITSSSAYSVTSGDYFLFRQFIEGFNIADLAWGTANAAPVTLSFWVRSSLTGTFGGSLMNSAENRSYPFSYTISSANTWEQKSVTIAGDTSGTWLTNNSSGIKLSFSLGAGSTYSGTAGAWSGSTLVSATGATSVVGTNGATFYITGVQLEEGVVSTNFDVLPYGTQLSLCQRYCQITKNGVGCWTSTTGCQINLVQNTEMRAAPSVSQTGVMTVTDYTNSDYGQSSASISITNTNTQYGTTVTLGNFTGTTSGRVAGIRPYSSYAGYILLTAEL